MKKIGEKQRNNKIKKHGGFLAFLIAAFVLIIAINVSLSHGSRLETIIVRNGSEEDLISANGYIFRKQTVVYAPADGYVYCEAAENERVDTGQLVMNIYKNQVNVSVNNELKKIEDEISELSKGLRTSDVFSSDSAKIEQNISHQLRAVPKLGARSLAKQVSEIKENVNELIEKRRIISGEAEPIDREEKLKELKSKKEELEKQHNIEKTMVHSPLAGAFTSRIDGAEEMLDISALDDINNEYFRQLNKLSIKPETFEKVTSGQPIGKIVNNFSWSIAVQIPVKDAEGLSVGNELGIRLPDIASDMVTGKITKITSEEAGKVILVITTNKYIDSVYSLSKTKVELVKNSFGGFRIPAKSLRMTDGVMGVYVVRNDKAKFVPVELLYSGKEWVVVDEKIESAETPSVLKLYDELVVSGDDIYDGKVVR